MKSSSSILQFSEKLLTFRLSRIRGSKQYYNSFKPMFQQLMEKRHLHRWLSLKFKRMIVNFLKSTKNRWYISCWYGPAKVRKALVLRTFLYSIWNLSDGHFQFLFLNFSRLWYVKEMISRFLIIDFQTRNETESIIIKVLASQFLIFNFSSIAKLWK